MGEKLLHHTLFSRIAQTARSVVKPAFYCQKEQHHESSAVGIHRHAFPFIPSTAATAGQAQGTGLGDHILSTSACWCKGTHSVRVSTIAANSSYTGSAPAAQPHLWFLLGVLLRAVTVNNMDPCNLQRNATAALPCGVRVTARIARSHSR